MPTLATVGDIQIVVYYNDHDPAHFHAIAGKDEAIIQIANLGVLNSSLPPNRLQEVLLWAAPRQQALAMEWVKGRAHLPMRRLPANAG